MKSIDTIEFTLRFASRRLGLPVNESNRKHGANHAKTLLSAAIGVVFLGSAISTAFAATNGTTRLYLHAQDVSEENATYNAMLPSNLPEGANAINGTDNSTVNFTVPPCEAAGFDQDNVAPVNEETANADRCVATFFSPVLGEPIHFETSDTNSIGYSLWASEEGDATTPVLRARLYEYDESNGNYNLISTSNSGTVLSASVVNYTWSATPDLDYTVSAGNRLVLVVTVFMGSGPDAGTGTDTINVAFERTVAAPAYMTLSYAVIPPGKPASFVGTKDDDFDESAVCASSCSGATRLTNPTWTIQTSGATTTESVQVHGNGSGSTSWLTITDVQTAATAATSLANYSYIWQSALTNNGDITAQVTASHARIPTTNPRNLAGLLLRFSADTTFMVLQSFYNGTNSVVQVNDGGTLSGSAVTITGNANNVLLRWTKTGTSYQAKYCTADTTDCLTQANWSTVGTPIVKAGVLDRVGLTARAQWVTGTNTQYSGSFDWIVMQDTAAPAAVSSPAASAIEGSTTTLQVQWTAPGDNGIYGTLEQGSRFAVQYATYSVNWSTFAVLNATNVYISTGGVTAGQSVATILTGLRSGTTYFIRIWTSDEYDNWGPLSAGATAQVYYDNIRVWTNGGGTGLWNSAASWSPFGTPTATDHVWFDNTAAANSSINTGMSVGTFTVTSGYTGTITANAALTVNGNWSVVGPRFNAGTSSVTLQSPSLGRTMDPGTSRFYTLRFNGSGAYETSGNPVTVSSMVVVAAGRFIVAAGSSLTVAGGIHVLNGAVLDVQADLGGNSGSLGNAGSVTSDTNATVTLAGTGVLGGPGVTTLPHVILTGNAQITTLAGAVTIQGRLTNNSAHTFHTGTSFAITISSSWANNGTFQAVSGSVTFTGTDTGLTIQSNHSPFNRLVMQGSGDYRTTGQPLTVSSAAWITNGMLTVASGSSMTVVGSVHVAAPATLTIENDLAIQGGSLSNAGSITSNSVSTVTLIGTGILGGAGTITLPNLILSGAAQTTTLAGPLDVQGHLTNSTGHTLDAHSVGGHAISVGGSWLNSGTYQARGNTVSLVGSASNLFLQNSGLPFAQLTIAGAGAWRTTVAPVTVSGNVSITGGTLYVMDAASMTVAGDLAVGAAGALDIRRDMRILGGDFTNAGTVVSLSTPTVQLSGEGFIGGSGSTTLPQLALSGNGFTTTLAGPLSLIGAFSNAALHTVDVNDSGSFSITVSSHWSNSGTFVPQEGTVIFDSTSTLTGPTTFYHWTATTPGITLTLPSTITQTVQGTLTLSGSGANRLKLRSSTPGSRHLIRVTGNHSISSVDVQDSHASGTPLSADASTNSGNNLNWTFGSAKTWIGPGNWSTPGNWSPSGVPGAADEVIFANGNSCTIDLSTTVAQMSIQATYSGTITANQNLTVSGGFTQAGGTMNAGNTTLTVGRNWSNTGGTFNPGSGTVILTTDAPGRTIRTSQQSFHNLILDGTGGYWTMQDSMTVTSSMTLTNGTIDTGASFGISVGRDWRNTGGVFVANLSTVTFTGSGSIRPGSSSFYGLRLSGGAVQTTTDPITVSSSVWVTAGTFTVAAGSSLTVAGNVHVSGGATLNLQNDTLISGGSLSNAGTLTSNNAVSLSLNGTGLLGGAGSTMLPQLFLSGGAQTTTLAGPIHINGLLTNDSGHTLNVSGSNYAITVSSSWLNSGTFVAQAGSVTFTGATSGFTMDNGGSPMHRLVIQGSGQFLTSGAPLTLSSAVWINAGTLVVAAGSSMTVAGSAHVAGAATLSLENDLLISGGSLGNAGTVSSLPAATLTLAGTGVIGGSGVTRLPRAVFSGNTQTTTLAGALTVQGELVNQSGHTLNVSGSNYAVTVSSSWNNSGTFVAQTGSVTFTGSTENFSIQSGHSPFNRLVIQGSGLFQTVSQPLTISSAVWVNTGTLSVGSGSTMTVVGTIVVASGASLDLQDNISINGGSLGNTGRVTSNPSATVLVSGTGVLGGSGDTTLPNLSLTGAAQTTTLRGAVTVQGNLSNAASHTLDADATGNYPFTVSGNWSNSGVYQARTSSVTFATASGGRTIAPGAWNFYKLHFTGGGAWQTSTNNVTVSSMVTVQEGTLTVAAASSMTVLGNLHVLFYGNLALNDNLSVRGGSLSNDGMISGVGTSTVTITGAGVLGGAGATQLPQLVLIGNAQTTTLGGPISVLGQVTNSAGHTLDADAAGNYQITVSSNWINNGTFTPRTGTVVFDSTGIIRGNSTFFNFTAVTPGITLTLLSGSTQYVSGALTLTGAAGSELRIRSTAAAPKASFNVSGTHDITYINVQDNSATGTTLNAAASAGSNTSRWTFGTTRIWDGSTSTVWSLAANWTPDGIPGPLDSVQFDATGARNCVLSISTTVAQITFLNTNIRTLNFNAGTVLTTAGNWTLNGGTVTVNNPSTIQVGGNWTVGGGVFNPGNGTVVLNAGEAGKTISMPRRNFNNITFNNPDGGWTLTSSITVHSSITIAAGTLNTGANQPIWLAGNWTNTSGTFIANDSSVTFSTSTAGRRITSNNSAFGHVVFNGAGDWTLQDGFTTKNLTLTNGTLDTYSLGNLPITIRGNAFWNGGNTVLNNSSVTVQGHWSRSGTTFALGASTIAFTGASASTIDAGGAAFQNVIFNDAGGAWSTVNNPLTVLGGFTVAAGTVSFVNVASSTLAGTVSIGAGGTWVVDSSASVHGGSIFNSGVIRSDNNGSGLTLEGAGVVGGSGSTALSSLRLRGNAQTTTLAGPLTIRNALVVENGRTLNGGAQTLSLEGTDAPFVVDGAFQPAGSTVVYSPSSMAHVSVASTTFGTLRFAHAPSTFSLSGPVTIAGQWDLSAGHVDVTASDWPISVGGSWITTDRFTARGGSVTLNGLGGSIQSGASSFNRLVISGAGNYSTASNPVSVSSAIWVHNGTLTVASGYGMTVDGSMHVAGGATLDIGDQLTVAGGSLSNAGTVTSFNGAAFSLSGTGILGGPGSTRLPALTLSGVAQTTTLGGPVTLLGQMNNASQHTLNVSGSNYAVTVSSSWTNSGSFVAQSGSVTFDTAGAGLTLQSGHSPFHRLVIQGSGQLQTATQPLTVSSMVWVRSGSFQVTGGSSLTVAGNVHVDAGATLALNEETRLTGGSFSNAGTVTANPSITLHLSGTGGLGGSGSTQLPRTLLSGAAQTTTLFGPISASGMLSNASGHTLDANTAGPYAITISSAWHNAGTFEPRTGAVLFDADAAISGNSSFYDFTANTPGITLTFVTGSTQAINGAFTVTGLTGNTVKLRSHTPGQQFYLNSTGSHAVTFANVRDSKATGATLNASASTNAGNNTNWTFGTTYVWVGPGNFSDETKWNPVGDPGPLDSVRFNNANNCTIDISTMVTRVTVEAAYSGTITQNQDLYLTAEFSQAGGTWNAGNNQITVGSNWSVTGGQFNSGTSTVLFNTQSSGRTLRFNGKPLHNVIFDGPGGYWTMQDSMTVTSSITMNAGTLDTGSLGNYGIGLARDWLNTGGSFVANNSTVTFSSASGGPRIQSGQQAFANVVLSGAGAWLPAAGPLTLSGGLTLQNNASLQIPMSASATVATVSIGAGSTLTIHEDMAVTAGHLLNAGQVVSLSTPTVTVTGSGSVGGAGQMRLPHLMLSGSGQTILAGPITTRGRLTNDSGRTLDVSASHYAITVSSSWVNHGSFTAQSGSVTLTGATDGFVMDGTGGTAFHRLVLAGSGRYETRTAPITVSSSVWVQAGTLAVTSGSSMTVTGNVVVSGGATLMLQDNLGIQGGSLGNLGTVNATANATLSLSGTGVLGGSGVTRLPQLDLSGNAQTTTLAGALSLLGGLSNSSGHTLNVSGSNYAITISSSWSNNGAFVAQTGSVTFNGSTDGFGIQSGHSPFNRLVIQGSGLFQTAGQPLTVSSAVWVNAGTLSVTPGSSMTVVGNIVIGAGATLDFQENTLISGGSLGNTGHVTANPAATLTVAGTGVLGGSGHTTLPNLTLSGAAQTTTLRGGVSVSGHLTNSASHTLDADASGNYPFTISGNWSNSGVYQARASSITFATAAAGRTINAGSSNLYKLHFTGGGSWETSTANVTVSSMVTIQEGTLTVAAASSMTVIGNVHVLAAGALAINENLSVRGGALSNAGTISGVGTSTLTLTGAGLLGGPGATQLPQLVLTGNAQTTTLGGDISVLGQVTNSSGHTLDANAAGNYQITVSSQWTNTGTFTPRLGSVIFDSTATILGNNTFYGFTAVTPGITLILQAGSTQYVTGALTLSGGAGNPLRLRTTTNGQRHHWNSSGSHTVLFANIQDSRASGVTLNASASTNNGNNSNWNFTTTRVWDGSSNTSWNLAANWTPAGVPGELESVQFDNTAGNNCVIDISTTVAQVTILGTFNRLITANQNLTVSSNWSQAAGTVTLNATQLTVGGNWTKTGGVLNANTSTVLFNATTPGKTIATQRASFNNVTFNGSGGYWTMQDSMTLTGAMTISAGTLDTGSNQNMSVRTDWLNNGGTFLSNGSTVTFTAITSGRQITSNAQPFGHVVFNGSNAVWTLQDALTTQNFTLSTGTVNSNGTSHYPITAGGAVALSGGVLTLNQSSMTVAGDWARGAAGFTVSASTVIFAGAEGSTSTITGSTVFANLTSAVPSKTLRWAATQTQTVTGHLTLMGAENQRLRLRSTSEPIVWMLNNTGTHRIGYVDVKDSTASGQTLVAGDTSLDSSGNTNWVFNYAPEAIDDLALTPESNGNITVTWSAPLDEDDNPFGPGSRYAIQFSSYAVTPSTADANIFISTSGVTAGSVQVYISTGLIGNVNMYFYAWTQDPAGTWSPVSNTAQAVVTPVLSVEFSAPGYNFGSVNMGTVVKSTVAVSVHNRGNLAQTFSLSVSTSGVNTVWTVGTSTPTAMDQFAIFGAFNDTEPDLSDFGAEDAIITSPNPSNSTRYTLGSETGIAVPIDGSRDLWLRLDMPTSTTTEDTQQMSVYVTGTTP